MRIYTTKFLCKRGGSSGAGSHGSGGASAAPVDSVRGIPQSQIDMLRGTRGHVDDISPQMIQEDYARVGINISIDEATRIHKAMQDFSGADDFLTMRKAYALELAGQGASLTPNQKQLVDRYKMVLEYTRIAPTMKFLDSETEAYRGLYRKGNGVYFDSLLAMKPGDMWDMDRLPSSFSTKLDVAEYFAEKGHDKTRIILHASKAGLKNSISISGLSAYPKEDEVLISDFNWKVASVSTETKHSFSLGDISVRHIYLEPAS